MQKCEGKLEPKMALVTLVIMIFKWGPAHREFVTIKGVVASIPRRPLKRIFGHSKVLFTTNLNLALWAQTVDLRPFRFSKNNWLKFSNLRFRRYGQPPKKIRPPIRFQIEVFFWFTENAWQEGQNIIYELLKLRERKFRQRFYYHTRLEAKRECNHVIEAESSCLFCRKSRNCGR